MNTQLFDCAINSNISQVSVVALSKVIEQQAPVDLDDFLSELIKQEYFDAACCTVIAADFIGIKTDAHWLITLLPMVEEISQLFLLLKACQGNKIDALLTAIESQSLSYENTALILFWLAYSCHENPCDRLLIAVRILAREDLSPIASIALGLAAKFLNDPEVNKVAAPCLEMAEVMGKGLSDTWLQHFEHPELSLLPEYPQQKIFQGGTLIREGSKVGRNDPCPCGSGKKYKKCCASKKADDAINPIPTNRMDKSSVANEFTRTMTNEQFSSMRIQEMCRQDLSTLTTNLLIIAFKQFCSYHRWNYANKALSELSDRSDLPYKECVDNYRCDLIYGALEAKELDFVQQQVELLEDPNLLPTEIKLELELHQPSMDILLHLETFAKNALKNEYEYGCIDLAYSLLHTYPALGLLLSRAALCRQHVIYSDLLLKEIEKARDRLQLPAGDPSQEIFDPLTSGSIENYFHRKMDDTDTPPIQQDADKTKLLRDKYQESRKRISLLENDLAEKEQQLHQQSIQSALENKETENPQSENKQTKTITADNDNSARLKQKINNLKSLLNDSNAQRLELRQRLATTMSNQNPTETPFDFEQNRVKSEVKTCDNEDYEEESGLSQNDFKGKHLFPMYSSGVRKSISKLPNKIVDAAMVAITHLSSHQSIHWQSVKRLRQTATVYALRVGIHYRLLFEIDNDLQQLEILDLIHRSELELAIKRFSDIK